MFDKYFATGREIILRHNYTNFTPKFPKKIEKTFLQKNSCQKILFLSTVLFFSRKFVILSKKVLLRLQGPYIRTCGSAEGPKN